MPKQAPYSGRPPFPSPLPLAFPFSFSFFFFVVLPRFLFFSSPFIFLLRCFGSSFLLLFCCCYCSCRSYIYFFYCCYFLLLYSLFTPLFSPSHSNFPCYSILPIFLLILALVTFLLLPILFASHLIILLPCSSSLSLFFSSTAQPIIPLF